MHSEGPMNQIPAFEGAEELFRRVALELANRDSEAFDKTEYWLSLKAQEIGRRLLQGYLDTRGNGDVGIELINFDDEVLNHRRPSTRTLISTFGIITLTRMGYSRRGSDALFPLDGVLNLPKSKFTYEMQKNMISEVIRGSFSDCQDAILRRFSLKISVDALMKIVVRAASYFEKYYKSQDTNRAVEIKPKQDLVVMTTDGKGVVMRPDGLREITKKSVESKPKTKRLKKGEKLSKKRMAQVAVVYNISRFRRTKEDIISEINRSKIKKKRPRPKNKRVWANLVDDSKDVIEEMVKEAKKRSPKGTKCWVALIDGDNHQFQCLTNSLEKHKISATIILDIIHVIEYLWSASSIFHGEGSYEREGWVLQRLDKILDGKASDVSKGIRIAISKGNYTKNQQEKAETTAHYLWVNSNLMRYPEYLSEGFPIATGVVEGACRHLVRDRMEITGARWSLAGAEAVLRLRSLQKSGDFDLYWEYFVSKENQRIHLSRYKNSVLPT